MVDKNKKKQDKKSNSPQYSDGTPIILDVDGEADDKWFEAAKKYVPEVIWNPKSNERK